LKNLTLTNSLPFQHHK